MTRMEVQEARERDLIAYCLKGQRERIDKLRTWIQNRPEDARSLAVGRELGTIALSYIEDCKGLGLEP